ncbi:MAG: S41 family peptidase [Alphaproteobacteria bacterium]
MRPTKLFLLAVCLLGILVYSLSVSNAQEAPRTAGLQPESGSYSETYRQLNLFGDVFERVRSQYVEPVEDKKLIENALNGMLASLDPHSAYLNEESFADMQVSTKGEFGGLGIEVTMEEGLVKVVSPIDDTPAFRAGVQAGDYIVSIDDQTVMGLSLPEAVDKMRGKVGTSIKLLIRRKDVAEPIEYNIVRDIIKIQSVKFETKGNAGYIRVTTFNQTTDIGLRQAVEEINKKLGKNLIGYVIDLRNNPGGLLNQAISVADEFLESGEIVSTRGREESDTKRDNATPGDIATGLPLVVIINGGSASASEIVAGALQDHKRAIVLGTKSFGKGSVQTVIPLPGHGAMRLTTARYYTPSGRSIQALGIDPDIIVEPAKIETIAGNPYGLRESDLRGALSNDNEKNGARAPEPQEIPAVAVPLPEATGDEKPAVIQGEDLKKAEDAAKEEVQDYQLLRALDLLNGVSLYKSGTQQ